MKNITYTQYKIIIFFIALFIKRNNFKLSFLEIIDRLKKSCIAEEINDAEGFLE